MWNFVPQGIQPRWQIKTPVNSDEKDSRACQSLERDTKKLLACKKGVIPRGTNLKVEYLGEFETESEKIKVRIFAHKGSIYEKKNRGQKSPATVSLCFES
jgi:hypothetical protein